MHKKLLASAAMLGLIAGGAYAQTPPAAAPAATPHPMAAPAPAAGAVKAPGTASFSVKASNIVPADTHSLIAPRLPTPRVGENASPEQLLTVANNALKENKTGLAQEALERAETRLLDRSTNSSAANQPDNSMLIKDISMSRRALGRGDLTKAEVPLQQALTTIKTNMKS